MRLVDLATRSSTATRSYIHLVRPLAFVALAACGSGERAPAPGGGSGASSGDRIAPSGKRSIDVSIDRAVTGGAVAIRGVEITPGRREGELEVGYRVDASSSVRVPARVMCRVGGRNVVYPDTATGKIAGPRLTSMFRPEPFREPVRTCEIVFSLVDAEHGSERMIARACWEADVLRDGSCAAAMFAPPVFNAGAGSGTASGSVALERASLELHDSTAVVTALYTLVEALPAGRRFAAAIACKDAAGVTSGEGALAFVPLHTIPVGASIYGPLTVVLERTPAADASCDVRLVSRATTMGAPEQTHARYCITSRAVRAGPC